MQIPDRMELHCADRYVAHALLCEVDRARLSKYRVLPFAQVQLEVRMPPLIFNTYPDQGCSVAERCSYTIEQYAVGGQGMWALSPPF